MIDLKKLFIPFTIGILLLVAVFFFNEKAVKASLQQQFTIPGFVHNTRWSGVLPSKISSKSVLNLKNKTQPADFIYATKSQPLLLNYNTKSLVFPSRHKDRSFINMTSAEAPFQLLWKKEVSIEIVSAGVADEDKKIIYFLGFEEGKFEFRNKLYSINFDGSNFQVVDVNLQSWFSTFGLTVKHWRKRVMCKTALTITELQGQSVLLFGCSRESSPDRSTSYGDLPGITGLIVGVPLDKKGGFLQREIRFFSASEFHSNENLGFDTGIYNSGSGFTVLPDKSLLIGTGNGPVNLSKNNFGCSVIRLLPNLTVASVKDEPHAFTLAGDESETCWNTNDELTTSTPTVTQFFGQSVALSLSKYGQLFWYDPFQFSQHLHPPKNRKIGSGSNYLKTIWFNSAKTRNPLALVGVSQAEDEVLKGPTIYGFQFLPDSFDLEYKWHRNLGKNKIFRKLHPIVLVDEDFAHPVVVYSTGTSRKQRVSDIHFVDVLSGSLLKTMSIPGRPHFSSAIVFRNYMFVPTRDKGLQVLEL